jgi:copper chaperone CopZ
MEKTVLNVPKMWADHHVLKVREVLTALDGVAGIYASSAWKQVLVEYDSAKLDDAAIVEALAGAGYGTDEELGLEGKQLSAGDPKWDELGVRVTRTNQRDLELSGDFRRY